MENKEIKLEITLDKEAFDNLEGMANIKGISKNSLINILLKRVTLVPVIKEGERIEGGEPENYTWYIER